MLVVIGSPVGRGSTVAPSGEIDVTPPFTSVAMLTQPSPSTASESNIWKPGRPTSKSPPAGPRGLVPATTPGDGTSHAQARPECVSATYRRSPAGDRPMPFGASSGKITSVID